jgi:hypothetical protein
VGLYLQVPAARTYGLAADQQDCSYAEAEDDGIGEQGCKRTFHGMQCSVDRLGFQYECETAISSSLWVDGEVCELSGYNLTVGSHYAYYD